MRENKSGYLFLENPLVVNVTIAKAVGLTESIIIQQISYWLDLNEKSNNNYRDGFYWTYNSYAKWVNNFPFWSEGTIKRNILKLEKKGILVSANYNKMTVDKTKWYRIDDEKLDEAIKAGLVEYEKHKKKLKDNKEKRKEKRRNTVKNDQPMSQNETTIVSKKADQECKINQPYQRLLPENIKKETKAINKSVSNLNNTNTHLKNNKVNISLSPKNRKRAYTFTSVRDIAKLRHNVWKDTYGVSRIDEKMREQTEEAYKLMQEVAEADELAGIFLEVGDIIREKHPELAKNISSVLWSWESIKARDAIERFQFAGHDVREYTEFFLKQYQEQEWMGSLGFSWGLFVGPKLMSQFLAFKQKRGKVVSDEEYFARQREQREKDEGK